eukprot:15364431-Ditylum_brightwellii.AAC.3
MSQAEISFCSTSLGNKGAMELKLFFMLLHLYAVNGRVYPQHIKLSICGVPCCGSHHLVGHASSPSIFFVWDHCFHVHHSPAGHSQALSLHHLWKSRSATLHKYTHITSVLHEILAKGIGQYMRTSLITHVMQVQVKD